MYTRPLREEMMKVQSRRRTNLSRLAPELYLVVGILISAVFCSIPFAQVVDATRTVYYVSDDQNRVEVGFGGPKVTWVSVFCNRTAEIRFLYQNGTWMSTQSVLVASIQAMNAGYNYNAEHATTVIEINAEGPFVVRIVYTYPVEMQMSLFERALYSLTLMR